MNNRFYLGLNRFQMPLNNSNSIIYGYFGNTKITGIDAIMKDFKLTDETNIENQIIIFSEFRLSFSNYFVLLCFGWICSQQPKSNINAPLENQPLRGF